MLSLMIFVPTSYIKVSIRYRNSNAYKANVLFLLLSSLVTWKCLQYSIDIIMEQSFRYVNGTHWWKTWISNNVSLCQMFANPVTFFIMRYFWYVVINLYVHRVHIIANLKGSSFFLRVGKYLLALLLKATTYICTYTYMSMVKVMCRNEVCVSV